MHETSRLQLPFIAAGQAQKHVTYNEALAKLDALVQLAVASRSNGEPPTPSMADACYIVGSGASGAWTGRDEVPRRGVAGGGH